MVGTTGRSPSLLIVEDDPNVARALRREAQRHFNVIVATSMAQAMNVVASAADLRCLFVDIALEDDAFGGIDVLEAVCQKHRHVSRAAITGDPNPEVLRRVSRTRTPLVPKPFSARELVAIYASEAAREDAVAATLERRCEEWELSPAERRILGMFVDRMPDRAAFAAELGITARTLDTHVSKIMTKARMSCGIVTLAHEIYRDARRSART